MPAHLKPPAERRGHPKKGHAQRPRLIEAAVDLAPKAPKGLGKPGKLIWRRYWSSAVASAIELAADGYLVERYARLVDELETVYPEFQRERLITGSMGQLVMNPLGKYVQELQAQMRTLETQLGIGPLNRMRLGVAIGESTLTADKLNERLDRRRGDEDERTVRPEISAIEADWSEAV